MSLVITADLRGFRLRESTDFKEGVGYVLDDGSTVSLERSWPATLYNAEKAAELYITKELKRAPKVLKPAEQSYGLDAEAIHIYATLKRMGFTLDEECRIRARMTPPFTEVTEDDIMPIIQVHLEQCEKVKKDPSVLPVLFGWIETEPGKGTIVFPYENKLAAGKHPGGRISLFSNRQVILSFQDWHLVPKGSGIGMLVQFLKCEPTGATSVKELCGKDKAVVEDGLLVKIGLKSLLFSDLSIDQF